MYYNSDLWCLECKSKYYDLSVYIYSKDIQFECLDDDNKRITCDMCKLKTKVIFSRSTSAGTVIKTII